MSATSDPDLRKNALSAIAELDRQVSAIENNPFNPTDDWNPNWEIQERNSAARAIEHVIGLHDGARSQRDIFCRLCQANLEIS